MNKVQPLKSRKFWVAVFASASIIAAAVHGDLSWAAAMQHIGEVAIGYMAAQGIVDAAEQLKKKPE